MIKYLRIVDRSLRKFFDYLGVPTLDKMDKALERAEDKLWQGVTNYKIKDNKSIIMPYVLLIAFAIVTIGSTTSIYAFSVPDIAKDGLKLTSIISLIGIVAVTLHLGLNKLTGED